MFNKDRTILEFPIEEFNFNDGIDVIDELQVGTSVTLVSEPDNPYNPEAVSIYYGEVKLGYVAPGDGYLFKLLYFGYGSKIEAKISQRNNDNLNENYFRVVVYAIDNRIK